MEISHYEVDQGQVEEFYNVATVADLLDIFQDVDKALPVYDGSGNALDVRIVTPKHLKLYVEVQ